MATSNKDFIVKNGLRVATGVTFPDGTFQETAFVGGSIAFQLDGGSPTSTFMYIVDGGTPSQNF